MDLDSFRVLLGGGDKKEISNEALSSSKGQLVKLFQSILNDNRVIKYVNTHLENCGFSPGNEGFVQVKRLIDYFEVLAKLQGVYVEQSEYRKDTANEAEFKMYELKGNWRNVLGSGNSDLATKILISFNRLVNVYGEEAIEKRQYNEQIKQSQLQVNEILEML